jgi:hypothetical protein
MKEFAVFLFIVGAFMIVHSVYNERFNQILENPRVEYKFLPRDVYYDQFFTDKFKVYYKDLFET